MTHTNINDLIIALKLYRDEHGKEEIVLEKLETIILTLNTKKRKKKK